MDTAPPEPAADTLCKTWRDQWDELERVERAEFLAIVDSISADLEAIYTGAATVH